MKVAAGFVIGSALPVAGWFFWHRVLMVGARGERIRNWQTVRKLRRELERDLSRRGGP